jgi:hypothetical protein
MHRVLSWIIAFGFGAAVVMPNPFS